MVLVELKNQLAKEDADERKAGTVFAHEMTPAVFIQQALDIEAAQYVSFYCSKSLS